MEIGHEQQTFWCHECDMSVSLLPSSPTSLLCPHCFSDLLELMDSSPIYRHHHHHQDNYGLNSPVLQRLIHHLSDGHDVVASPSSSSNVSPSLLPASKAYVDDGIPTVKMKSSSSMVCAVCKEQFAEDVEAKQLPCNHLYHPHCILPWLSSRSSCPLCRFQLPTDTPPQSQDSQRIQRLLHYRLQLQLQRQQQLLVDTSNRAMAHTLPYSYIPELQLQLQMDGTRNPFSLQTVPPKWARTTHPSMAVYSNMCLEESESCVLEKLKCKSAASGCSTSSCLPFWLVQQVNNLFL